MASRPRSTEPYQAVAWHDGRLRLLDQTRLPGALVYLEINTLAAATEAITSMRVCGAPAIGIAAAYALALVAQHDRSNNPAALIDALHTASRTLAATRPTAVNLRWALDRVLACAERAAHTDGVEAARSAALAEARAIQAEQIAADARMAQAGAALIAPGSTLLTHCNAGPLATTSAGTALGAVIPAHRARRVIEVLVNETRPRLQGARLTAWELGWHGAPYRVIADSAAASLMAAGLVSAVVVGADRIAVNGDTANKIDTYALAALARFHALPLYVVAPLSTIDAGTPSGAAIPIEQRDATELLVLAGITLTPPGARALNPAFDITPVALITAIVTERGVLRPPYAASIAEAPAPAPAAR
ncbi:MAG: S-methyl-5-thioribose-1-phosphate isomerase [Dehalococcoidia bacterium]|nr:S-methyl-5-thioribose-1-phosphate isomerase [Dehalococcoidia bacterium]